MQPNLIQLEDKFEILETLNEGGMGVVFKVRHRLLDDIRVIKVIRAQLSQSEDMNRRFLREAKMATKIRNPGIARLIDFATDAAGNAYLEMEFIDGYDLKQLSRTINPLGLGPVLEIARQTLDVLAFLHRHGVIHRDISPDNLMLTRDEEGRALIKLIDLGIAKSIDDSTNLTLAGTFLGKIRYSSPEQIDGEMSASIGPASDLYSFGIVLYELLLGSHPFKAETGPQLITAHLHQQPRPFSSFPEGKHLPRKLEKILRCALEKAPDKRYRSAENFQAALESFRNEFVPVDADEEFNRIFDTLATGSPGKTLSPSEAEMTTGEMVQERRGRPLLETLEPTLVPAAQEQHAPYPEAASEYPIEEPVHTGNNEDIVLSAHPIFWNSEEQRNRNRFRRRLKNTVIGIVLAGGLAVGMTAQWKQEFIPVRRSFNILPAGVTEVRIIQATTPLFEKADTAATHAKISPVTRGTVFYVEEIRDKWLRGRLDARSAGPSFWIPASTARPGGNPVYAARIINNGDYASVGSSLELHFVLKNTGDLPARDIGAKIRFTDFRDKVRKETVIKLDHLVIAPGETIHTERTISRTSHSRARIQLFWKSDAARTASPPTHSATPS